MQKCLPFALTNKLIPDYTCPLSVEVSHDDHSDGDIICSEVTEHQGKEYDIRRMIGLNVLHDNGSTLQLSL